MKIKPTKQDIELAKFLIKKHPNILEELEKQTEIINKKLYNLIYK